MKHRLTILLALLLALAAGQALADDKKDSKPVQATPAADADESYVIGAEDVLKIDVWKEPEMSATVPVRPDGKVSLPLLNDVQAAGLTPLELAAQITEKCKKFVEAPRVTVVVTQINSRKFFVLGEVTHPGAFPLLPNINVLQALSAAGGLSQYANGSKIYVLRTENGKQNKYAFNYKQVVRGENAAQNIVLKPGDTIVVP